MCNNHLIMCIMSQGDWDSPWKEDEDTEKADRPRVEDANGP